MVMVEREGGGQLESKDGTQPWRSVAPAVDCSRERVHFKGPYLCIPSRDAARRKEEVLPGKSA